MKKILVWITLLAFINLTGCYSHELLAPASYNFDEKKEIKVITKDTMYNFKGNQYILVNDTLIGTTRYTGINLETVRPQDVKVPVKEMNLVEVTTPEGLKTMGVFLGVLALVFLGVLALVFVMFYIVASSTAGGAIHLN